MNDLYIKKALNIAYEEAKNAYQEREVPVGAVLLIDEKVALSTHNSSVADNSLLKHAELKLFEEAKGIDLFGSTVVVTLEPCLMCLGAMINAGIKKVYFGAFDSNEGAFTHYGISLTIKEIEVHYLEDKRCSEIMTKFFKYIRLESLKLGHK